MKKALIFLLAISSSLQVFATAQIADKLVYKGDTISIFANPLERFRSIDSLRPKLFGDKAGGASTDCWRGYQAGWIIVDSQLYLTGIYSCNYYEDGIEADLKSLFGDRCIDGRVKVDWFTANIISPQGKLLYYIHMGYQSIYEKELELQFINGRLIGTKVYDNSKSKQSIYCKDGEKLKEWIYSSIDWGALPMQDTIVKVIVQFFANENGTIDSAKVVRRYNVAFDQEAIRVVKTIPEWDVYFRHGKIEKQLWSLPIIFSEECRKKYTK